MAEGANYFAEADIFIRALITFLFLSLALSVSAYGEGGKGTDGSGASRADELDKTLDVLIQESNNQLSLCEDGEVSGAPEGAASPKGDGSAKSATRPSREAENTDNNLDLIIKQSNEDLAKQLLD